MSARKIVKLSSLALALASTCWMASASHAGLLTYPNSASWTAAVSGATNVSIPNPGGTGSLFIGAGNASVTYGGVTFSTSAALSDGNFFAIGPSFDSSANPPILSSQQETTGTPNVLITFPSAVTAFSLDYGTFQGTSVNFTLSNGDTLTQGSTAIGNYSVPDFVGVTDTTPFTSVLVTTTDPGHNNPLDLNNVSFGSLVAVPEPASLTLLGVAASGLVAVANRRRKR